jgi:hypothetical protein
MVIINTKNGPVALKADDIRIMMEDRRRLAEKNDELEKRISHIIKEESVIERYAVKSIDKLENHLRKARRQRDTEKLKADKLKKLLDESIGM